MLNIPNRQKGFVKSLRRAVGCLLDSANNLRCIAKFAHRPLLRGGSGKDGAKEGGGQGFRRLQLRFRCRPRTRHFRKLFAQADNNAALFSKRWQRFSAAIRRTRPLTNGFAPVISRALGGLGSSVGRAVDS